MHMQRIVQIVGIARHRTPVLSHTRTLSRGLPDMASKHLPWQSMQLMHSAALLRPSMSSSTSLLVSLNPAHGLLLLSGLIIAPRHANNPILQKHAPCTDSKFQAMFST